MCRTCIYTCAQVFIAFLGLFSTCVFSMHLQALLPAVNCICLHLYLAIFKKLLICSYCIYFAIIHDNYPVAVRYGSYSLCNYYHSNSFQVLFERSAYFRIRCHVYSTCGVIQYNYLWFFNKDLAIQSLCFCPPEKFVPPCSTQWSDLFSLLTKGHAWACFNASIISSSVASSLPISYCLLQFPKIGCSSAKPLPRHLLNFSKSTLLH